MRGAWGGDVAELERAKDGEDQIKSGGSSGSSNMALRVVRAAKMKPNLGGFNCASPEKVTPLRLVAAEPQRGTDVPI